MIQAELALPTYLQNDSWNSILGFIDATGAEHASQTTAKERKESGQVFTPLPMARQLVSLVPHFDNRAHRYADPGTGTGMLSAALIARHAIESKVPPRSLTAYETDKRLHEGWVDAFANIGIKAGMNIDDISLNSDFYAEAESILTTGTPTNAEPVSHVVINPPYKKLGAKEHLSLLLREHGIFAPNHYAAFLGLAVCWLEKDGELLAILPRSFFNGSYFKRFRTWLKANMSIEHIVAYSSRSNFGKNVLQENICLYLKKCEQASVVRISYCDHPEAKPEHDLLVPAEQMLGGDIWYLPCRPAQLEALQSNAKQPCTLGDLGLTVSTGAVEVHRPQCTESKPVTVLYSGDFNSNGELTWAESNPKKPRFFASRRGVFALPTTGEGYVAIKRISANDGLKPRLFPVWVSHKSTGLTEIGFDNHVQVFSLDGKPLPESMGLALVEFLAGQEANACMSTISGTTQVNIDDLKMLRYPNLMD